MKPVVGILAETDDELTTNLWITYVSAIEKAGGVPVILPYAESSETLEDYVSLCDGLLFTGGVDIEPIRYGEKTSSFCGKIQKYRDEHEFKTFEKAFRTGKPILAICRGCQLVNVAFGGTLYQDLPTELPSEISHRQTEEKFSPSHSVRIERGSPLYELLQSDECKANSFHHQAIKTLGKDLAVMATAHDGVIEAVYFVGESYLRAYQWHPERLFDSDEQNRKIFGDFIGACKRRH
jgi:putative glutamine amidotransferase